MAARTMSSGKFKKLLLIIGAAAVVLMGAGYLANFLSADSCEQDVAKWLISNPMASQPFHSLPGRVPGSYQRLVEAGGQVTEYVLPANHRFAGFPWAEVTKAHGHIPFISVVDWTWYTAPFIGNGGRRYFLCLFGVSIELGDRVAGFD